MAFTIIGQKRGPSSTLNISGQQLVYSETLEYILYDTSGDGTLAKAYRTPGLPKVNRPLRLPDLPYLLACKKKSVKQEEKNKRLYYVSCDIDNTPSTGGRQGGEGSQEDSSPDPTSWWSVIDGDLEEIDIPIITDTDGWPIVATTGRRYQSPLTKTVKVPVIRWKQYEPATRPLDYYLDVNETVNKSPFLGAEKGTWMLTVEKWAIGLTNGRYCWELDLKIRYLKRFINPQGGRLFRRTGRATYQQITDGRYDWQDAIYQADTIQRNKLPCKDEEKNRAMMAVDENGLQLDLETNLPVYVIHNTKPAINFNWLRIRQRGN